MEPIRLDRTMLGWCECTIGKRPLVRCITDCSAFLGRCHLDMTNFARARLHERIKSPDFCTLFSAFTQLVSCFYSLGPFPTLVL